jgi:hypothetical protein
MAVNIFVCGLLFFLYWKNIINRKIILFGIAWFVVCLFPTFLTQDYLFLTHRVIISSFGIIMILSLMTEKLLLKYPHIKKYLTVFCIIAALIFSCFSYTESDK